MYATMFGADRIHQYMKTPSESFKQPDTFKVQEQRNVGEETQVADEHAGRGVAAPSTSTETT